MEMSATLRESSSEGGPLLLEVSGFGAERGVGEVFTLDELLKCLLSA